jgi:hypothetical protein
MQSHCAPTVASAICSSGFCPSVAHCLSLCPVRGEEGSQGLVQVAMMGGKTKLGGTGVRIALLAARGRSSPNAAAA